MSLNTDSLKPRAERARHGRSLALILFWTLLTMSAGAVARPTILWLRAPLGGVLAGALTGLLQWTALGGPWLGSDPPEDALPGSGWWVAATGVALGLASLLQGRIAPDLAAILTGTLVGVAQWLVLRRSIRWSAHWILMSAGIAWPAASLAITAVAWLTPRNSLLIAQVLAGALQGALVGAATGVLLVTVLPGANDRPPENHSSEVR